MFEAHSEFAQMRLFYEEEDLLHEAHVLVDSIGNFNCVCVGLRWKRRSRTRFGRREWLNTTRDDTFATAHYYGN
jgi:hypothetical protein